MGKPITTTSGGICFAFPNVCQTPTPGGPVPIPYPSIGQLSDAQGTASSVKAGSYPVVTLASDISTTTGDAAGSLGPGPGGEVTFPSGSGSVKAEGSYIVRMFDQTLQNGGNASGHVLGGLVTVLVGD